MTFDSAYTKGDFLLLIPGVEIWCHTTGPDARCRYDGEARGGVILETGSIPYIDLDTGEKTQTRAFRVYDPDPRTPEHQRMNWFTETQLDVTTAQPVSWRRLQGIMERWCREAGKPSKQCSADKLDLVIDAARLAAIIGQRGIR